MTTLDDIHYTLGRVDGKVTLLIDQGKIQDDRHAALDARVRAVEATAPAALELRVRKLEYLQYWFTGAAAFGGALLTYISKGIISWKP